MNATSRRRSSLRAGLLFALVLWGRSAIASAGDERPNILWIVGEDASPHLGCYGETAVRTPHLDTLARNGVRFANAFVTCPVCSPSRTAMVTGTYQTSLGAHNHRSQRASPQGGSTAFHDSYRLPAGVKLVPQLFKEAGYFTSLGSWPPGKGLGKTDYNFIWDESVYDAADWRESPKGKPFFAQVLLRGGKNRGAKRHGIDPAKVTLPPYYPDHPVLRADWADYLNSWMEMDDEVGAILAALEEAGAAERTIVFFWTDHGVSHLRGKQFLYDEGIRVPLIVRFPGKRYHGTVRQDLVLQIDVAATSLAFTGTTVPPQCQGLDLFASDYRPRDMVFAARDRCDETVDLLRCVRTRRYKYIRNFLPHVPHAQPNQYKDGKLIVQTMRELHAAGKLDELQARPFARRRPAEELYDLEKDPFETQNLAATAEAVETLPGLREALDDWMARTRDLGLIPEPILEELGRERGSKHLVLAGDEGGRLAREIIALFDAQRRGDEEKLRAALRSPDASLRYWGATALGGSGELAAVGEIEPLLDDRSAAVRVAAALALSQLGVRGRPVDLLARELTDENVVVGLYAARALEEIGAEAGAAREAIARARTSPYEFTRRVAERLTRQFAGD